MPDLATLEPDSFTIADWRELTADAAGPQPPRRPPVSRRAVRRTPLRVLPERPPWQQQANCRGCNPGLFFIEQEPGVATEPEVAAAKEVCRDCVVTAECLEDGLYERFGVWGGMSLNERRAERKRRRAGQRRAEAS